MHSVHSNFLIPMELTDFRANHAQTTNLARHMRSRERGNERERERNRDREQGIGPKGNSVQQPNTVLSRWSVLIKGCICFCNERHNHKSRLWPKNRIVTIELTQTWPFFKMFPPAGHDAHSCKRSPQIQHERKTDCSSHTLYIPVFHRTLEKCLFSVWTERVQFC